MLEKILSTPGLSSEATKLGGPIESNRVNRTPVSQQVTYDKDSSLTKDRNR